ncbi:MAG: FUN14 domain-containing protein [Candidatus Bathyarchaeia archaeon]
MSEIAAPIVFELALGGFGGFLIGYAFKKTTKTLSGLLSFLIIALLALAFSGILILNPGKIVDWTVEFFSFAGDATKSVAPVLANLPLVGSFIVGLILGLKLA